MDSQFLNICQLGTVEEGKGSGFLKLNNYQGGMSVKPLFLALEGIHQVAVRAGKKVIKGASSRDVRVLPVNINQFTELADVELKEYEFACEAAAFGPSARVTISVNDAVSAELVINAQITVARV